MARQFLHPINSGESVLSLNQVLATQVVAICLSVFMVFMKYLMVESHQNDAFPHNIKDLNYFYLFSLNPWPWLDLEFWILVSVFPPIPKNFFSCQRPITHLTTNFMVSQRVNFFIIIFLGQIYSSAYSAHVGSTECYRPQHHLPLCGISNSKSRDICACHVMITWGHVNFVFDLVSKSEKV